MQAVDFEQAVEKILARDARYRREAYVFVREALDFTQKIIAESNKDKVRHVTGQELLGGIRKFALQQFGPMTILVLNDWGVQSCEDFGEIVFNMVDCGLLAKTDTDTRDDFRAGYTFFDAFRQPFTPSARAQKAPPEMSPERTRKGSCEA